MIPLDMAAKGQSVEKFKQLLCTMINQSGGLPLVDEPEQELEEDDIEIPKSEFIDEEPEPEPETGDVIMKEDDTETSANNALVTAQQLSIAIPKDKTSPYSNQWIPLDDSILKEVSFNDYDILAFGIDDEPLQIVEAAYEE